MNISVKGEYALHALFDLASQPRGEPVKIADIARRQKIPQKFLELILASLKQGGFVESKRGAEGGYFLARAAESITVGQVIRFVEAGASVKVVIYQTGTFKKERKRCISKTTHTASAGLRWSG
jgi:Rrf2 family cysteine metabolism transcriptional repressor